jgi:antitoxin CcdA
MNTVVHHPTLKRPVNLTLSDELVQQARAMTSNLSAVVETLLADYVRQQTQAQQSRRQEAALTAQAWNNFNACAGSFADEYSTL